MPLALRPIAHSETGLVRRTNQDSGYVSATMLLIADGMGGAAAGDLASAVAATELQHANDTPLTGQAAVEGLRSTIAKANTDLARLILRAPELDGMGTTVCGGIFDGRDFAIAHIGDSRGYLLREGQLRRLTHDHSYVQSLIDEGRLDEEGARTHPHRSLILRVLNGQPDIQPDYFSLELRAGDRIMFCSDGLCGLVGDQPIAEAMTVPRAETAMEDLIALAHAGGGTDNITIVMADVVEDTAVAGGAASGVDDSAATRPVPPGEAPQTSVGLEAAGPGSTPSQSVAETATARTSATGSIPAETADGSESTTLESPVPEPTAPDGSEATLILPGLAPDPEPRFLSEGLVGAAADPHLRRILAVLRAAAEGQPQVPDAALAPGPTAALAGAPAVKPTPGEDRPDEADRRPSGRMKTAAQQERERYAPTARRSHKGIWLIALAIVLVLAGAAWGVYAYVTHQYYVADHDGRVAIYQGLPGDIAGITTSRVYDTTSIQLADLPVSWRNQVTTVIASDSLEQAQSTVQELRIKSEQCLAQRLERPAGSPIPADGC